MSEPDPSSSDDFALWPPVADLDRPVSEWPGLEPAQVKKFAGAGIRQLDQLLWHSPLRHEDRRDQFGSRIQPGTDQALVVRILSGKVKRMRRGLTLFEAEAEVEALAGRTDAQLQLRWWRMPYLQRQLAEGTRLIAYGKVKEDRFRIGIDQPDFEVLDEGEQADSVHWGRIVPVYGRRDGVPQRTWRALVAEVLDQLPTAAFGQRLPADLLGEFGFDDRRQVFRALHFPDHLEEIDRARRILTLEQLAALQAVMLHRRRQRRTSAPSGSRLPLENSSLEPLRGRLPFALTGEQEQVLEDIRRDMSGSARMTRLLQGDVGSGKTVVAMAAIWWCLQRGQQAALMAPTQILAEQLHAVADQWLAPLGVRTALLTSGKRRTATPLPLFDGMESDDRPQLVVGTHALLFEQEWWSQLGLAVIDEQHKFGVAQRRRLLDKAGESVPDVLVMTATPIPRTLQLTTYGDLDVSVIPRSPGGRGPIVTAVRKSPDPGSVADFIRQRVGKDERVYLVYPRIDEETSEDLGDDDSPDPGATDPGDSKEAGHPIGAIEAHRLWMDQLPDTLPALLHGRMKPAEKSAAIEAFRQGQPPVLVGTQVIEVGVDVPEATVMIIFHAERLGLAQLHQLRGRVGRGHRKSWCILVTDSDRPEARDKLAILERNRDGFAIAEADLRLRGPGNVIGREQSGRAPLTFPELAGELELVTRARAIAEKAVQGD